MDENTLLARLASGEARAALTLAGQGSPVLPSLTALIDRRPELRPRLEAAAARLDELAGSPAGQASGRFRLGYDLLGWCDDPEARPPDAYLRSSAVSFPLVLLTQLLAWEDLWLAGFDEVVAAGSVVGVTGHSQGLLGAVALAEAPLGPLDDDRLARYLDVAFHLGVHVAATPASVYGLSRRGATSSTQIASGPENGAASTPMVAVTGVRLPVLGALVEELNASLAAPERVTVALVNAPENLVLSGPPTSLALVEAALAEGQALVHGSAGAARLGWSPLAVDVPYHSPALREPLAGHLAWLAETGMLPEPGGLALPVLSCSDPQRDLRRLRDGRTLAEAVARDLVLAPVRWDAAVAALVQAGADWVIDLGPGTDVSRLTARNLQGRGPRALPLGSPEGMRILTTPGVAPSGSDLRYAHLAPALVEIAADGQPAGESAGEPGGRLQLDNRYVRATGQPPVILPGMTPTTADVPIVAAAANVGYTAELAGGGQPTARILRARLAELTEALHRDVGVVFNTLYMDRRRWHLHVGDPVGSGLVFEAKRAGAPLVGLTVSAGVPDVDEAVRLLDALAAEGLVHNAFKPGTVEQIRQVVAIAQAAPRHTVFVHVEGGKAGGHHSYEGLEALLLAGYHELRRAGNVVLCAGGGVGTPERAASLLTGRWSLAHGEPAMPVDAVLVGTAAMACAEAAASPQVKELLADTPGTGDWVPRRGSAGGIYSGLSSLGADIHTVDNAAARAADLLSEVAGDAEAVAARRAEIVAALAKTAKPYFGEVAEMTYAAVLRRFTELCAIGRSGRYEDGAWLDPSWRAAALALYRRWAARLDCRDEGRLLPPVAAPADLDDPPAAQARFVAAYPEAERTVLHPGDAVAFVEVCATGVDPGDADADRPMKPVPFVPVLDADVRRWFMADALWQAQDPRYDADGVIVIPGPESVAGITRTDEPMAELLARFETGIAAALSADTPDPTAAHPSAAAAVISTRGAGGVDSRAGTTLSVPSEGSAAGVGSCEDAPGSAREGETVGRSSSDVSAVDATAAVRWRDLPGGRPGRAVGESGGDSSLVGPGSGPSDESAVDLGSTGRMVQSKPAGRSGAVLASAAGPPVDGRDPQAVRGPASERSAPGASVGRRDRLRVRGLAPEPLASAAEGRSGPVAALCVQPLVDGGRNPLWALVHPGDEVEAEVDEAGRLRRLEARPRDGRGGERLVVAIDDGGVTLSVTMPTLDPNEEVSLPLADLFHPSAFSPSNQAGGVAEPSSSRRPHDEAPARSSADEPADANDGDRPSSVGAEQVVPGLDRTSSSVGVAQADSARDGSASRTETDGMPRVSVETDGVAAPGDSGAMGGVAASGDSGGVGGSAVPGDSGAIGQACTAGWMSDADQVVAYRAVTGAAHDGVPVDWAFSLAWPALTAWMAEVDRRWRTIGGDAGPRTLRSVTAERGMSRPAVTEAAVPRWNGGVLAKLVHHRHRVAVGEAWPPLADESGTATANLIEWSSDRAGLHLDVEVELRSERDRLATVHAGLLLRGVTVSAEPPPPGAVPNDVGDGGGSGRGSGDLPVGPAAVASADSSRQERRSEAASASGSAVRHYLPDDLGRRPPTVGSGGAPPGPVVRADDAASRVGGSGPVVSGQGSDRVGSSGPARVGRRAGEPGGRTSLHSRRRVEVGEVEDWAPEDMAAFARVGGDRNPLHRSVLAARLAGLEAPVVHGMWTAARAEAFLVHQACDGEAERLRDWSVQFTAPVRLGAELRFEAARVGVEDGGSWLEVVVSQDDAVVALARGLVAPPRTAVVFPGQGVQRRGLGGAGRDRSRAARQVWQRVDAHAREALGLPLLDVVERNPVALWIADGLVRHPHGVLHRTEITQPVMVALAAAQLAELRGDGALPADLVAAGMVVAGHSVGELSALVALDVLSVETGVELAYRRGLEMQAVVPRNAAGESPFRLAAVDPSRVRLDLPRLEALVHEVSDSTGELAELVNHNAAGRQYVVAGTRASLAELELRLYGSLRQLEGIDVPFHSSVLRPAIDRFRARLQAAIGRVDHRRVVGHWVPNLLGRPFALEMEQDPDEVARRLLIEILARHVAEPVRWIDVQRCLVEPRALGGLGIRRQIEIGPLHATVLSDLAPATLATVPGAAGRVELLHAERDRARVLLDDPPSEEHERSDERLIAGPRTQEGASPTGIATGPALREPGSNGDIAHLSGTGGSLGGALPADRDPGGEAHARAQSPDRVATGAGSEPSNEAWPGASGVVAERAMPPPGERTGAALEDRAVSAAEAVRWLLAVQAHVRPDQLREDETMEELFAGASSRRNQVLVDLGRELGLAEADGLHELPLGRAVPELATRAGRYRFPGGYLRDTVSAGLTRAMGPAGLARRDAVGHLEGVWVLTAGLVERALVTLVLETRPGESARGGSLGRLADLPARDPAAGRALLDRAVELLGTELGVELRPEPPHDNASGRAYSSPTTNTRVQRQGGGPQAPVEGELVDLTQPGEDHPVARLELLDREHGEGRAAAVRPMFDHRRHVCFASSWASARWDLVALYHDAVAQRRPLIELQAEADRLTRHGDDPALAASVRWFAAQARSAGRDDVAQLVERVVPGRRGDALDFAGQAALVTGASPGSIAASLVAELLAGGAQVVVATSTATSQRRRWYRDLYRRSAAPGAELHVVPANLASFGDIDALLDWLSSGDVISGGPSYAGLLGPPSDRPVPAGLSADASGTPALADAGRAPDGWRSGQSLNGAGPTAAGTSPPARLPSLVAPFAAMATVGDAADAGGSSEVALRIQLLGVERLVAGLARLTGARGLPDPVTVLLPLSPNHGDFGGDGCYSETKAALEVLARRRHAELESWGRHARIVAARIGWVRGTGLMGSNDDVAPLAEEHLGIRTFTAPEMGRLLAEACAAHPPQDRDLDLTGGLADLDLVGVGLAGLGSLTAPPSPQPVASGRLGSSYRDSGVGRPGIEAGESSRHRVGRGPTGESSRPVGAGEWTGAGSALAEAPHVDDRAAASGRSGSGGRSSAAGEPRTEADRSSRQGRSSTDRTGAPTSASDPLAQVAAGRSSPAGKSALLDDADLPDLTVAALPNLPPTETEAPTDEAGEPEGRPRIDPAEMVVIVGTGELGPCGTARSRFAMELGGPLPADVVVELAWLCGLVRFERSGPRGEWVDTNTGEPVPEPELAARYRAAVAERTGLRTLEDDGVIDPAGASVLAPVQLDRDVTFEVGSEDEARSFLASDPAHTEVRRDPATGVLRVTRRAGAQVRMPRQRPHTRRVAGQLPRGLPLAGFGVPGDLLVTADRLALVNLACTAEAFRQAGLEPVELLERVHPAAVANTQGAGMGGMSSVRHLFLDLLLDGERQSDRLQEALGNVMAAHVVQAYVGSYGAMLHPVAACATAAVSLEAAYDKIRAGKALAVVAGGYDDLTPEGMAGFGDMQATVASDHLEAMGLDPAEASRPNDVRRGGFVEAQGGGSFLVVRGDVALDLGLPVRGVLVYAGSFGDGIQTSIPAPGRGLLAAGRGGPDSPLAAALQDHGLSVDDIAVVSKHDTSTPLNDPNEADLHQRLQTALGRTLGNPLLVVSQKAVTGHAKGGAAAWQVAGVLQMLATGRIPGNRNLDTVDPRLRAHHHLVHGDRTISSAPSESPRAALVTSLGFGHVSGLLAVAHPDVFMAGLARDARRDYLVRAGERRSRGERAILAVRYGAPPSLRRASPWPTDGAGVHGNAGADATAEAEAEAAMLLGADRR